MRLWRSLFTQESVHLELSSDTLTEQCDPKWQKPLLQRIQNGTRVPGLISSSDLVSAICYNLGPQVPSVAISKAEPTVLGICGSFLAQADRDARGLAVGLSFVQSLPFYHLGSQGPS